MAFACCPLDGCLLLQAGRQAGSGYKLDDALDNDHGDDDDDDDDETTMRKTTHNNYYHRQLGHSESKVTTTSKRLQHLKATSDLSLLFAVSRCGRAAFEITAKHSCSLGRSRTAAERS